MKKSGFASRALSLLLVLIMVFQLVPITASAGEINTIAKVDLENYPSNTGVDTSTLNQEGTINWPVKIYDYLNDGMLFEYANVLSESIGDSTDSAAGGGACYGGGKAVLYTEYGVDFTCEPDFSVSTETGTSYTITQHDAVDYVSPQYVTITKNTAYQNSNLCVGSGYSCDLDDIRYMTLVYRGSGLSDDKMSVLLGTNWYRTPDKVQLADSEDWTYVVLDVKTMMGANASYVGTVYSMWITWGEYDSTQSGYEGLNDGSSCDLSHVAFFSDEDSAYNYGDAALAFNADPGQYLNHSGTLQVPGTKLPDAPEPDVLLSLRDDYKADGSSDISTDGHYGMDLTTSSTENGQYTNGYNTDTYWTWESGVKLSLPYGSKTKTVNTLAMTVQNMTEVGGQSYVRLSSSTAGTILLSKLREDTTDNNDGPSIDDVNYLVLVYRTNGMAEGTQYALWGQGYSGSYYYYAGLASTTKNWASDAFVAPQDFVITDGTWTYEVIKLDSTIGAEDSDMYEINYLKRVGMHLPAMGTDESLDLAYIAYFGSNDEASTFGADAAAYMNSGVTTNPTTVTLPSDRGWNAGNNQAFGMLYASCGGHWGDYSYGYRTSTTAGGSNSDPNGYYSYMIGYNTTQGSGSIYNTYRQDINGNSYTANYTDPDGNYVWNATGTSNNIYYLYPDEGFNTSEMQFDGYQLIETVGDGLFTAGLLEGTLTADRLPVYRQETVEYIAQTLYNALAIPQTDASGNYNYNFVKGSASTQFGGYDLNGDGVVGMADLNGDGRDETDENSVDLATAIRGCLNLKFTYGQNKGSFMSRTDKAYGKGSYEDTLTRASGLKGTFAQCRDNIQTCMDAAYYLLNNIFVDNSYNQLQDDFGYMTLSGATVTESGKFAYVFDAGFTTGIEGQEDQADYAANSHSAIKYTPYARVEDGQTIRGDGTISLHDVNSKDMWYYFDGGSVTTTRFPFLPIYDNEGDYADESTSYYFCDDGVRSYRTDFGTYQTRNYNYVLASNGEFVYREEDGLFFQFEGDDDVYLFINGQIVLDIGGAHSITSVSINVDDYVTKARAAMEPLEKFGYYAGMPSTTFDALLDSATKDDGSKYSDEEKIVLRRQHKLNLVEGQICQFDFYYMERHGYGANMRIVTNMHVTDSKLGVEKTAYQYGEEIEYGGIIDPAASAEYNFKLTNTGSMKLYNLTFSDETIGVDLSYENGLTVDPSLNGLYVLDANNQKLDASDLTAVVSGWKPVTNGKYAKNNATGEYELVPDGQSGTHDYVEVEVSFADNDALIQFLKTLEADGLETSTTTEEITQAGSGLWVDASVQFKGIYYILTPAQVEAGMISNTVYVTATNKADPTAPDCEILRSDASHRAYTSGAPAYFQWADNTLYLSEAKVVLDANEEAGVADSQLNPYEMFFKQVVSESDGTATAHTDRIYSYLTDKYGRTLSYDDVSVASDGSGFNVSYSDEGTNVFYLLMYLNESNGGYDEGTTIDEILADLKKQGKTNEDVGCYAIVRVTIYTAKVEDAYYVLDYGLKTESLDTDGILFKDDYLFGDSGGMEAKLMGVTNQLPSYLSWVSGSTDYNRISFTPSADTTMTPYVESGAADGNFNVNMVISDSGKAITYDSVSGHYSLTGAGTMRINAKVPIAQDESNDPWEKVCLYYWYDNGTNNGWPGTEMTYVKPGEYYLEIPGDVTHVIINNGSVALQTPDLSVTAGVESTIEVAVDADNNVTAEVETVVQDVKANIQVPADWGQVYLNYKSDEGDWQVTEALTTKEGDYYVATIPGSASYVYVSSDSSKRSNELDIISGLQFWVDTHSTGTETDGVTYYGADISYSKEYYTVRAKVPAHWADQVYLYYWYSGSTSRPVGWPGEQMTGGEDGWYTLQVPVGVTSLIINDGTNQTADLMVQSGLETEIVVNDQKDDSTGKYSASVTSACLTFTPTDFMDNENSIWMAITVHTTGTQPSKLGQAIDINNEVQMFKKVTVLPANVVYYEDDFTGIQYNDGTDASTNTFTKLGSGSTILSQGVDPATPYGQDEAYQDDSNAQISGNSLHKITIGAVPFGEELPNVATFTFTGTGFEVISRTNAVDSASFTVTVYKESDYGTGADPVRMIPVITQFDNGDNGGDEEIYQVPAIRVDMDAKGTYVVEIAGNPDYDFTDWENPVYQTTYLYIDGLRIFQPLGATNEHYPVTENGASFTEIRDNIATGTIGVAQLVGSQLTVSSGTTTWTEDLHVNDEVDVYESEQVDNSDSYMIQGPNNEAYMVGGSINTGLVMYFAKTAASDHELQVAVRGLDYDKFNSKSEPAGVYAMLQCGVLVDGAYSWQDIAEVVTGTEQYYSIPLSQCPVDANGNYQVVLRVTGAEFLTPAMVSYTSIKTVNLALQKIDGIGEKSLLTYYNGLLVSPEYHLFGNIDGVQISGTAEPDGKYQFVANELTIKLEQTSTIGIQRIIGEESIRYMTDGTVGSDATSVTMYNAASLTDTGYLTVPGGHTVTLKLHQSDNSSLSISYELTHIWDEGTVTTAATCQTEGVMTYKCQVCGYPKTASIPMTDHNFVDGKCSVCGTDDTTTYYFRNTNGWSIVKAYTWTGDTTYTGSWPGSEMTLVDSEQGIYSIEVAVAAKNIIFTDGSAQTADLTLPTDGTNLYLPAEGKWLTYMPDCTHTSHSTGGYCNVCGDTVSHTYVGGLCSVCGKSDPTTSGYYLVGYINGADYGCEADYQNLGEYKFEDGTLIATFTQDSYVFLKTGDNINWYLTKSYCTDTTGTFYLNASEKMFVPGNVEITFTLRANADGTLTLSYTTGDTMTSSIALNLASIQAQMSVGFEEAETVVTPVLDLSYPTLSFEDEIVYNAYFTADDISGVVEMGMITFSSKLTDGTIDDAVEVISGYTVSGSSYVVSSNGIPAKNLGDALYFKVYAKLSDGSYVYSDVAGYNAVAYANTVLSGSDESAKALVVAMLNYGAAAQVQFSYNTDSLMNASLTEEQLALVDAYDESMVDAVVKADSSKVGLFVHNGGYTKVYPTVSFEGAFAINYYFATANTPDSAPTFYYWDAETYANATELTAENATGTMDMVLDGDQWYGTVAGIAAKEIDQTYYTAGVYYVGDTAYYSPVVSYSLGNYCETLAAQDNAFGAATAVYGYYAKAYFAS